MQQADAYSHSLLRRTQARRGTASSRLGHILVTSDESPIATRLARPDGDPPDVEANDGEDDEEQVGHTKPAAVSHQLSPSHCGSPSTYNLFMLTF